jgi:hypothetical protein
MSTGRLDDLQAFRDFVIDQVERGADLSPADALSLWEYENQGDDEREDALRAIRQGLADVDAGRVRPFEEFDRELRARRGISARA